MFNEIIFSMHMRQHSVECIPPINVTFIVEGWHVGLKFILHSFFHHIKGVGCTLPLQPHGAFLYTASSTSWAFVNTSLSPHGESPILSLTTSWETLQS